MLNSEEEFRQTARTIDASLNRIGEGLRFLEEIARMTLDDAVLTEQLKSFRHTVLVSDTDFQQGLLDARKADSDTGADMKVPGESENKSLRELLIANSRRVQESLRTLEEIARMPGSPDTMDTDTYRKVRFGVYTLEKNLYAKLARQDRQAAINGLYVIIDTEILGDRSHADMAGQVIRGGAGMIQLRDKIRGKKRILETARELNAICSEAGVLFLVNDHVDIALAVGADGVHLGQDDIPVGEARKILPVDAVIGCTTTDSELARAAQDAGADYVAAGAVYPTDSKRSTTTPAKVIGLATLKEIKQAVRLPVVAIGGINNTNAADVMDAGADAVAVIGAVLNAESPEKAARMLTEAIKGKR